MSFTQYGPWDFGLAHEVLRILPSYTIAGKAFEAVDVSEQLNRSHKPSLGNFDAIFKLRGVDALPSQYDEFEPTSIGTASTISSAKVDRRNRTIEHTSEDSSYSTAESSPTEHETDGSLDDPPLSGRWGDEVAKAIEIRSKSNSKKRRPKTRSAFAKLDNSRSSRDSPIVPAGQISLRLDSNDLEAGDEGCAFLESASSTPKVIEFRQKSKAQLPPDGFLQKGSSPPSRPAIVLDQQFIALLAYQTMEQKRAALDTKIAKLVKHLAISSPGLSLDSRVQCPTIQIDINNHSEGIHIFIDSSNTVIGFQNSLKKARNIHQNAYVKRPPISFESLARILERGRETAKRVLVGSSRSGIRPDYMAEAEQCGYEVSVLEHVKKTKMKELKTLAGKFKSGYGTSGYSSGSDGFVAVQAVTEQGVDEILHMKMLESIVDTRSPSTMVVASGDAAEAEYSGGFFKNVIRALEAGWNVEIVAWRANIGYAYRAPKFRKTWKDRFRVIELDDFSEELLAIYVPSTL